MISADPCGDGGNPFAASLLLRLLALSVSGRPYLGPLGLRGVRHPAA